MTMLAVATPAPTPKSKDVITMSIFYAIVLVVMAVAQLFTFEELILHFVSIDLPGGRQAGYLLAAGIVALEVFALPFLLRMSLSSAFRFVSMVCGWLVSAVWLYVSIWIVIQVPETSTIGFLGLVVDTMPGWWAVLVSIAFGILAAWSSWGMWPLGRQGKHRKSHH